MPSRHSLFVLVLSILAQGLVFATVDPEFEKLAMSLREKAILRIEPPAISTQSPSMLGLSRYPWKRNIVTTVFWVGERATRNNPVPNCKSSWDPEWHKSYGGYDNPEPEARRGFFPKFVPRQNPFYVALPYNDVTRGETKLESRKVIPWFREAFEKPGQSVCKGRWVAIRRGNRIAYAQWEDCGPFRTDHWQYVFGNDRPKPNLNQGAGLDVSPAVRDYLGMGGKDVCDWKFVDFREVPPGPWTKFGDNNTFVLQQRGSNLFLTDRNNARSARR
ncbi:MAG: hypothetical protein WCG66_01320 [bacterium]